MSTPLPYYSALSTMLQILRRRGDLPEALSLCKWARELKVAGNWSVQIEELESRMRDE